MTLAPLHPVRLALLPMLWVAFQAVPAQTVPQANRNLILLDPAHGGPDRGASLSGGTEKDATVAFAATLRQSLTARAFTVVATRESDLPPNVPALSTDARAGTANHLRPAVCLILHATGSGNGIHVDSSPLTPNAEASTGPLPWQTAQIAFLPQSLRLANHIGLAILRARLPVLLSRAALRPLDNLTCPAVAIEIAPLIVNGRPTSPFDAAYQHRVAEAIAAALVDWRNFQRIPAAGSPGRGQPMIPRYQRILFWSLSALILLVSGFTIYERQKSHNRVNASNESMPFIRPVDTPTESVILLLAHDAEGTVISGQRDAALPTEPSLRAAALLDRLVFEYGLPNSTHPLSAASAVEEVFLLPLPSGVTAPVIASASQAQASLAVVNLRSSFADGHPSGLLIESLTIASMTGTLHANFPEIAAVRFLVDGQPRETLAGHADLLRLYPAVDPSLQHTQPIETREP